MASGSLARLSRLLLQRSDRHPIACIDAEDLAAFDRKDTLLCLTLGVITERAPLQDDGERVLQVIGDRMVAVTPNGDDPPISASPLAQRLHDIRFQRICDVIRRANGLGGRGVEVLNDRAVRLGSLGKGSRRRDFYMARALRDRNALDVCLSIKARAGDCEVVIFTPTERNLSKDIIRRLSAERISMFAADDLLKKDAAEPFLLTLPLPAFMTETADGQERLVIDIEGHRANFEGVELVVAPREFEVLVLLANELKTQNGFVPRETISDAIRTSTGSIDANEEQVDKAVSRLRKAFRETGKPIGAEIIEVRRKVGYRLNFPREGLRIS